MRLKLSFEVNAEIDDPAQAAQWRAYIAALQRVAADAIEKHLVENEPPKAEWYEIRVTKVETLV